MPTSASILCPSCNYDLRNLPSGRCPECGTPFDPADPKTFHTQSLGRSSRWLIQSIGWPLHFLALISLALLLYVTPIPTTLGISVAEIDIYKPILSQPAASIGASLPHIPRQAIFFLFGVALWLLVLFLWLARCLLRLAVLARRRPHSALRGRRWSPALLLAFLLIANSAVVLFGWPGRVAPWFLAHSLPWYSEIPRSVRGNLPDTVNLSEAEVWPVLTTAIQSGSSTPLRLVALGRLMGEFPQRVQPFLESAATRQSDPLVLATVIKILGLYRDPASVSHIVPLLDHPDPQVRSAAADALGIIHAPAYPIPVALSSSVSIDTDPPVHLPISTIIDPKSRANYAQVQLRTTRGQISPDLRGRLEAMMLSGRSSDEREAAARALLPWPPEKYSLRCAEWGVWVSHGGHLAIVQSQIEQIPPFVHRTNVSLSQLYEDRFRRDEVHILKPIVHITASHPMSIDLDVRIRRGRPLYAYPRPDDFGLIAAPDWGRLIEAPSSSRIGQIWQSMLPLPDAPETPAFADAGEGYPWLSPAHRTYTTESDLRMRTVRQSRASDGAIRASNQIVGVGLHWQSLIVSPNRLPWMTPPDVDPNPKFQWWSRLRDVPSSWISSRGEAERFLYYDGPSSLPSPVDVTLKESTLHFRNVPWPDEEQPMDMGGEFPPHPSGKRGYDDRDGLLIHVENSHPRSWHIPPPLHGETTPIPSTPHAQGDESHAQFLSRLTSAGLTEPEARGMLDAWKDHFFSTNGRRYLLFLSESDYDAFCPLSIRPAPTSIARVGLVLFEFP